MQADLPKAQVPLPLRGAVQPVSTTSEILICSWNGDLEFSRRSFFRTGSGYGWSRVDQTPVPRAPARALLRLSSAEDRFGLILRDDEAALPRLELE